MQKLIESTLAKREETGSGLAVFHINKPLKADKREPAERVLAEQPSRKQIKQLFKEERHDTIRVLLQDQDQVWSQEVVLSALEQVMQRLEGLQADSLDHTSYEAFEEISEQTYVAASSKAVKLLGIKGKSQKQYSRSLISLLFILVLQLNQTTGRPNSHLQKLTMERALNYSNLLFKIWEASCQDGLVNDLDNSLLETASVYLNRITTDKSDARECLEMLEQARENLGLIESNIEDSIECACVIDAVVNLASQDDHNKPIAHYKMRF